MPGSFCLMLVFVKKDKNVFEEKKQQGLNGWLMLIGLGTIISALKIVLTAFPTYIDFISGDAFNVSSISWADVYGSPWALIILGEMLINIGLAVGWFYVAFLFFSKKKTFPKCYIGILLFSLTFMFVDALVVKMLMSDESGFDVQTSKAIVYDLFMCCVLIPYMLISKRVKATFIE